MPALWCFCTSRVPATKFANSIRSLKVTEHYCGQSCRSIFEHWQRVAAEEYPNGLPEPHSNDPTQWLFKGHPKGSTDPLQVAVARLLGYRWPDQEPDNLDALADADGIVPIPCRAGRTARRRATTRGSEDRVRLGMVGVAGAQAADRGRGKSGTTLDDWLRNSFFEQHCKRFHQRPFVWHLWDGRKDGFSCLVNYHKLTHKLLDNLTYSYVQDWINLQAADARSGKPGADLRLAAAQALQEKLKLILAGEPPYDIFVRWKPLSEQPIGWNPDLNDGVRMNIRPFVKAGILRKPPNIKWTKDRGKEPQRPKEEYPWFWKDGKFVGDRVNDIHLTNARKQDARKEEPSVTHGRKTN